MVHFINGSDSGDILCRAEVLPRINKVKMAALESYGIVFFSIGWKAISHRTVPWHETM